MSQPRPFDLDRLKALLGLDGVTWRHDVDQSLAAAVHMARYEQRYGATATYYLMPRSPYYNLFSKTGRDSVHTIRALGHTIGVHCDLGVAGDVDPLEAVLQLANDYMLLRAGGYYQSVFTRRVSFHCPPMSLLWMHLPGYYSAYAPDWEGHYCSDSRGVFAYGDPEDRPERPLQINLHPEHWFPEHAGFWR